MSPLCWSAVLVLLVAFTIIIVDFLIKKEELFTTPNLPQDASIEAKIRLIIAKNPKAHIVIINSECNKETTKILKKLACDFPQIVLLGEEKKE